MTTSAELKLDHFLFYDVGNQRAFESLRVQTQFDRELEPIRLTYLDFFANPVSKNGEKIYDPNAHLMWYDVYDPSPDPTRSINLTDQFGRNRVITGRNVGFLAPTQKARRGGAFPERLDHFRVYQVLDFSKAPNKKVKLRDQWGTVEATVGGPVFFAAPSRKVHDGEAFGINNAKAHMVIYRISPSSIDKAARFRNQFGSGTVNAGRRVWLGVPCKKGRVAVEGGG